MDSEQTVIEKTRQYLQDNFKSEATGHDYWHFYRVWQLAKHIGQKEQATDMFALELAALLHDIADWKFHEGDEEAGPRAARVWLQNLSVDEKVIVHVEDIIRHASFKGASIKNNLTTLEGKIVHDADKLDAIGAIGIARAFATGAYFNEIFYDPTIPPQTYASAAEYRAAKDVPNRTVINHFYEKLLLLKDRMLTTTGRQLAEERHAVTERFLKEFLAEWEGGK